MIDTFFSFQPAVQAAIVSALVALIIMIVGNPLKYFIGKSALRHKLSTEYEYEQRKQLRALIGRYYGRLLEAAEKMDFRMWNLYSNQSENWLAVHGAYSHPERYYYFATTVYRFLSVLTLVRQFENEATYIDPRYSDASDLMFMKYTKAFHWVCTDTDLYRGLTYNNSMATDHFFSDGLRQICDSCLLDNRFLTFSEFESKLKKRNSIEPVLRFFDGLCFEESRYRWDRLVAFHLLLMAFISSFGYDMQIASKDQFENVAGKIKNKDVAANLASWLNKLGLGKNKKAKIILKSIKSLSSAG